MMEIKRIKNENSEKCNKIGCTEIGNQGLHKPLKGIEG